LILVEKLNMAASRHSGHALAALFRGIEKYAANNP